MGEKEHTTRVGTAALLVDTLESYGIDPYPVIEEAGIDTRRDYHPDDRLPVSKLQRLWRLAVERTGDPCLGLRYAEHLQPAALHGLGLAWLASDSLLDGLNRLVRYQRIVSTVLDIRMLEEGAQARLVFYEGRFRQTPVPASIDATLASFFRMCRLSTGPDLRPAAVSFRHPAPPCRGRFDDFFGVAVEFGAEENQVVFDRATLERPLPAAHPELARVNDEMVIQYLARFDHEDVATRVRARIIELLPGGLPPQERIARELNLSLRNLQRKLQAEGTSYSRLMDEIRRELAIQYLRGSDRPIIEIGFLLGFSETSNFTRAFRRWTGCSPSEFRRSGTGGDRTVPGGAGGQAVGA